MNIMEKGRIIRLMIIGVSAILVVNLSRSIWDLWNRRDILYDRQAVLDRLKKENKRLGDELIYSESPLFIEQEARNRLGLGKEGEEVVLIPNNQLPMTNGKTEEKKEETLPNWKKWWRLFF